MIVSLVTLLVCVYDTTHGRRLETTVPGSAGELECERVRACDWASASDAPGLAGEPQGSAPGSHIGIGGLPPVEVRGVRDRRRRTRSGRTFRGQGRHI